MWKEFHPTAETFLSFVALVTIAVLSVLLLFFHPQPTSKELLLILIGALAGAVTVGGGRKVADKITNSTGDHATVQPDAAPPAPPEDITPA